MCIRDSPSPAPPSSQRLSRPSLLTAPPIGINPGCTAAITSAAYCGGLDSGLLLLGSLDGTIRVWKPAMS
eukprot:1424561-Prymnesium_polylepis.1